MTNAPLDAMLSAHAASGDPRLLVPALDLCAGKADFERVLGEAGNCEPGQLGNAERARLAAAAVEHEQFDLALRLADGVEEALTSEIAALLASGDVERAESRYRAAVRDNPAIEDPELMARIAAARAPDAEQGNVIAFNAHREAPSGPAAEDEVAHARLSFAEGSQIDFADVGGHAGIKKQIERRIIAPFRKPALFARFRRKAGGGVLLYGPPGCGKTLLARATAGECEARFINVPVTDVLDKYVGEPERKLAAIFEDARRETPSVLFFDELEALAGKRGSGSTRHEMSIVSSFLAELDGFAQNNEGVLILAATNMPWAVDPAFRRSGRFDRLLFVPPPDREARAEILKLQLDGRPVEDGFDVAQIARRTSGFSGADLMNLADTAADYAIEESIEQGGETPITAAHFIEALEEVKATTSEWLTTARNFAKYGNSGGQYDEVADFIKKHGR